MAIGTATALTAAATVGGALINKKSADKAAKSQSQAADEATKLQERMFEQSREDIAPFRETGVAANQRLAYLMGLPTGLNKDTVKADLRRKFPNVFGSQSMGENVFKNKDYASLGLKGQGDYQYTPQDFERLIQVAGSPGFEDVTPKSIYDAAGKIVNNEDKDNSSAYLSGIFNRIVERDRKGWN